MRCGRIILAIFALVVGACDRSPPAPQQQAPRVKLYSLELWPVTPLLPSRPTHVAIDVIGNLYWVQETEDGDDIVFVMGEGAIPRATLLTSANVLKAMNLERGAANFHSITAGVDGAVYFYVLASRGRELASAIGRFDPRSGETRIITNSDKLMSLTGMGRSIGLARGKLITSGAWVWVWIRHSDDAVLMRFDAREAAKAQQIDPVNPFKTKSDLPVGATPEGDDLSAGPDGSLLWLSPSAGTIRRITADGGSTMLRSLAGFSSGLSAPAMEGSGRLVIFASDTTPIPSRADTPTVPSGIQYPAMLMFDGDKVEWIGRNDILAYSGFHVGTLRLNELITNPAGEWVAYDTASGELIRLRIKERFG